MIKMEEKNHLIQISQAYKENLMTQKITQTEIDYITKSIVPLLEDLRSRHILTILLVLLMGIFLPRMY